MKRNKPDNNIALQNLQQQCDQLADKNNNLTIELLNYQAKYKQASSQIVVLEEELRHRDGFVVDLSGQISIIQNQLLCLSNETAAEERGLREAEKKVRSIAGLAADIIRELAMLSKMSQLVEDIFVQTHILSILANVEVAEAEETVDNETGANVINTEAFRVIAGEIKKLAADSSENVQTIKSNVSSVNEAVQKATALTNQLVDLLQTAAVRAGRVNDGMKSIKKQLQHYQDTGLNEA